MTTVQDHLARFFYTMSAHQYITPLNSIISASQLLKEEGKHELDADRLELLDIIYASGHKLFRISKKMQWFFMLRFQERSPWIDQPYGSVPLDESLRAFRDTLEVPQTPRFTWTINVPDGLTVRGNARMLEFMTGELLENAFRHGDEKRPIAVAAFCEGETLHLTVINAYSSDVPFTGAQIEPFCNVQVSAQGVVSGTGLGLFLLKDWAESLGGSMQAEGKDHLFEAHLRVPLFR